MVQIIDYDLLVDELKRDIVRKSLKYINHDQVPGSHHFYISFLTSHPNVAMSRRLLERHPHEMTIVLQHQFRDLIVKEDYFGVTLQFDGIEEEIEIPYAALISFADPSVKFGLYFKQNKAKIQQNKSPAPHSTENKTDNVIILDQFRNK